MTPQIGSPTGQDQEAESARLMLDVIETRDPVTQRNLAGELGIALGLANIYLKRWMNKSLVTVRKAPARRYAYRPTARGLAEKAGPGAEAHRPDRGRRRGGATVIGGRP